MNPSNSNLRENQGSFFATTLTLILLLGMLVAIALISLPDSAPALAIKQQKALAKEQAYSRREPELVLAQAQQVVLQPRTPVTPERAATIRGWIAALAKIDGPSFGLSGTMTGAAFLPSPNRGEFQMGVLTDHRLTTCPEMTLLVENGIEALPYLLSALDDKTPTNFKVSGENAFGMMSLEHEIQGNPLNPREASVLKTSGQESDPLNNRGIGGKGITEHVVTIGDVCFVLIGQIVGRPYRAVRYQPTACVFVNSPTDDALLCEQVRQIWSSDDPAKTLLDSLLIDFSTREVVDDVVWGWGEHYEIQAAMRLLYYYPRECEALVAARLKSLSHGRLSVLPTERTDAGKQVHSIDPQNLVRALAWIDAPEVRPIIQNAFLKTDSERMVLAALPAMLPTQREVALDRLVEVLSKAKDANEEGLGFDYLIMQALIETSSERAKEVMTQLLQKASASRARNFIEALAASKPQWAEEILLKLLDDQRPAPGFLYRVSDSAAMVMNRMNSKYLFEWKDQPADRDQQIEAMKRAATPPAT